MSLLSTTLIAFSMSADAFAIAASKGATLRRPRPIETLRVGGIFGSIAFLTTLLGWALGFIASSYVTQIDHWIAFGLLAAIGSKMIWEGLHAKPVEKAKPRRFGLATLVLAGIGSSIDALAIGVTLAFLNSDIVITALAIGGATFLMASLGMVAGRWAGVKLGRIAEVAGGLILIGIGTRILLQHLEMI